jgi:hypothetical protein
VGELRPSFPSDAKGSSCAVSGSQDSLFWASEGAYSEDGRPDPRMPCALKVLVQEADTNGLLLAERAIDAHLAFSPNDHQRAEAILILEGGLVAVVGAFVRCSIGLYEHSSFVFRKTLTRNSERQCTQNALGTPSPSQR